MPRHPTPITDELEALGSSLATRAHTNHPLGPAELQRTAVQLGTLARQTAPLELFHAELIAEAAEEELRQPGTSLDFSGHHDGDWTHRQS